MQVHCQQRTKNLTCAENISLLSTTIDKIIYQHNQMLCKNWLCHNWPVCQLTMSLFASILRVRLGQFFGYNQLGYVDPIAQQIWYGLLSILDGTIRISVNQDLLQATVDKVSNQRAVVPSDRLDTFAVHLVMHIRPGKVQTCISFFVDEKIWKINLS